MIPVVCNIHSWMKSWIGVLDHPFYAVSTSDGAFSIANVPPGDYTIEAWHEILGTQQSRLTVASGGAATADFTFKGE
jgi:hypothetical protein